MFGYYIEVTNSHLRSVPGDYLRKQTLSNGERYITPELKEYEAKVLNSESLMEKLETALLTRVREQVAGHYPALKSDQQCAWRCWMPWFRWPKWPRRAISLRR